MLTRKQLELLDFIQKRVARDGVPPSFDEMKDALDLRSKSGIHRLITALEERGFIRRLAHRARAIEIVKLPDAMEKPGFSPRVIEGVRRDHPDQTVVLVTHGGMIVAIRAALTGEDRDDLLELDPMANAAVSIFEGHGDLAPVAWNLVDHLELS